MVFYPSDVAEAYWMKNTLVPLSIAFVAADGRVVSVAEMTPCKADPCPSYPPAGPYRYAVELAAGSFGEAGIGPAKVGPLPTRSTSNRRNHAGQRKISRQIHHLTTRDSTPYLVPWTCPSKFEVMRWPRP